MSEGSRLAVKIPPRMNGIASSAQNMIEHMHMIEYSRKSESSIYGDLLGYADCLIPWARIRPGARGVQKHRMRQSEMSIDNS